jgi:hypothetical protein
VKMNESTFVQALAETMQKSKVQQVESVDPGLNEKEKRIDEYVNVMGNARLVGLRAEAAGRKANHASSSVFDVSI